jgi:catechol 2,3-dioxygenase-like lactoylglutathione lyase family enzyme
MSATGLAIAELVVFISFDPLPLRRYMLYFAIMITAIDHIVFLCPTIKEGLQTYRLLLGREPDWQSVDSSGIASAYFQLDDIALELIAPHGQSETAVKLRDRLRDQGPGLQSIIFRSDNLEADRRVFERRALKPDDIQTGQSVDIASGRTRKWTRFRINDETSNGVRMFVLQRDVDDPLLVQTSSSDAINGLDHLVITTANPDKALALYGSRLGLRLTLDLSIAERDMQLLSFKAGDTRIEMSHRISKASPTEPDKLWGITWRTNDIEAAHARMTKSGLNVSEVRKGMSKGTRVFTVRDGTLNVPTLILADVVAT